MKQSRFSAFPLWLATGILYGLSWPSFEGLNLSFLAWFAFVPLFFYLEKNQHASARSLTGGLAAMLVFAVFSALWLFDFPDSKLKIAVIFFIESVWLSCPFLFLVLLQKRIGFDRALWLFPLVWMLWEWTYLHLEFTMGTHLSAYSQSSNLWLIQMIDITGMWAVSFWLMLFNVLLFKVIKNQTGTLRRRILNKQVLGLTIGMLALPVLYSAFVFSRSDFDSGKTLSVRLLPTQYAAADLLNNEKQVQLIERMLHRSDSLAFEGEPFDLLLWPETGLNYQLNYSNLEPLLREAVGDWQSALLTGCKGIPEYADSTDHRKFVSGVLLSSQQAEVQYHHKTALTPGQECIPYHAALARIPQFPIRETDPRYFKRGKQSKPLVLKKKEGETIAVGVSLCYEQWHPEHWARLACNGAEVFAHLAGEGWYGSVGFQTFMANVTRMRCIETRHPAARCANVGLSLFIDPFGRTIESGNADSTLATLRTSSERSFYAQNPHWFPLVGFAAFLFIGFYLYQKTKQA
ncbi:MAG: apolipoprotein N-acyltransferase [Saprospiraceae bacterium]